jgi:hypothetical protein
MIEATDKVLGDCILGRVEMYQRNLIEDIGLTNMFQRLQNNIENKHLKILNDQKPVTAILENTI